MSTTTKASPQSRIRRAMREAENSLAKSKTFNKQIHYQARLAALKFALRVVLESEPDGCDCCDRSHEYNGFGSGQLKFVCPKGCPCLV